MRKLAAKGFDVFLSATVEDAEVAETVKSVFENAGLSVFPFWKGIPVKGKSTFIRRTLTESRVVGAVVTKEALKSDLVQFIFGASWALKKPVHILLYGIRSEELPVSLRRFQIYPLAKLPDVVSDLAHGARGKIA